MIRRFSVGAAALLLALALPAAAQQGPPPPRPMGPPPGMGPRILNVELGLRLKDRLKLNDSQVSQLEALRKEIVAERQARAHDMIDIQSRIAAGELKREDVRKQFEDNREAMRKTVQQRQDRIAKILTQEQQDQLARATRRFAMMRMQQRRGFGGQPGFGRGFGRGMGRGFAPGMRRPGMRRGGFGPGFPPGPGFDQ